MFVSVEFGMWWGGVFTALLLVACVLDIRMRRIPNALVLTILAVGVGFALAAYPLQAALIRSMSGVLLGFSIWIVFWLLGLLGAGDVKFFAATGAWLGPGAVWRAALIAGVLGGLLAIVTLLRERRLRRGLERTALVISSRSWQVLDSAADSESGATRHLPYGLALAGGALIAAWVPSLIA